MSITPSVAIDTVNKTTMPSFNGKTLYVGGIGEGNYTKIQDAIDNANSGDTVFVYYDSSPYYENVIINKSICLVGEDKDTTIIDGEGFGTVVNITVDNVNLSGFTIQNSGDIGYHPTLDAGISIHTTNCTITNNIVISNKYGICILSTRNNLISYNEINSNKIYGIYLYSRSNNNTIIGNTVNENKYCGIYLHYSKDNEIVDNQVSYGGDEGINLFFSSFNKVINNTISNNSNDGINARGGNQDDSPRFNLILNNIINNNNDDGIFFEVCSNNTVSNNIINSNNRTGLWFEDYCYNNIINNNTFCFNKEYGGIKGSSGFSYNTISYNTFINNFYGIFIRLGAHDPSDNNQIYHNNFINNTENAYDECNNIWDDGYPSGGNYWDDYNGTDTDGDGIGDTPYHIPGDDNEDRYPLMSPYVDTEPPNVEITKPEKALYIFNFKIRKYLFRFRIPLIIGKITIEANVTDEDSGIKMVEFYINGKLKETDTTEPYTYLWRWNRPRFIHIHLIKVVAYDNSGNVASDKILVRKIL